MGRKPSSMVPRVGALDLLRHITLIPQNWWLPNVASFQKKCQSSFVSSYMTASSIVVNTVERQANSYTVSYTTEILRFGMIQCYLELTCADKCSCYCYLTVTSMVLDDVQHIYRVNGSLVEAIDAHQI